jgi:beta-phosphoglucomutase
MIKAFIFDLDGVMVDTAQWHYQAWKKVAEEDGIPFTWQDYLPMRGLDRVESLRRFLGNHQVSPERAEALMQRKSDYFLQYVAQCGQESVMAGVLPLLDDAQAQGLRLGVASSSRNARPVLEKLGLTARFDVIADGNMLKNKKPAPDVFVWVAGWLHVLPAEAVVFEDSREGVEAALAGGFHVVGVGRDGVDRAHLRLPSLANTQAGQFITFFS